MKYDKFINLSDVDFRRLTGVKHKTFDKMVQILQEAEYQKKLKGGKPNDLPIEDRLLMALEYNREYRTYFHVANSYGISESSCYRNIKWIEDVLVKHPDFSLPSKRELLKSDNEIEVILIDATESPVERPKKNRNISTRAKRKNIP